MRVPSHFLYDYVFLSLVCFGYGAHIETIDQLIIMYCVEIVPHEMSICFRSDNKVCFYIIILIMAFLIHLNPLSVLLNRLFFFHKISQTLLFPRSRVKSFT